MTVEGDLAAPKPKRRARPGSPPLRVVSGGLEEVLKKRTPPKDKRYLNQIDGAGPDVDSGGVTPVAWSHRHLEGIAALSRGDIQHVLDSAERWFDMPRDEVKNARVLHGRTIVNLFYESSTRTRTSFEVAGKRLGADVVNVSPQTSSVTKGETLLDTAKNLEALRADAIVLRHPSSGAPGFLGRHMRASIVNAGDGEHEHPTQALLDAFTIRRGKKRLEGLVVAICGDILHSRVARSNALLLGAMGVEVRLCGPRTLMPRAAEALGPTVRAMTRIDDAVAGADVVMMLRIQTERPWPAR